MKYGNLLFCLFLIFGGTWCEEIDGSNFDFQTYQIFKIESTYVDDNSPCDCALPETDNSDLRSSWGKWSTCQGHQMSFQCHRSIQYQSRKCSAADDERTCKQRKWKYCFSAESCTGQWQSWTDAADGGVCSHTCGGGVRLKVRACVKNNEIGLFCLGKNRSPYDIRKEACNTQQCPVWSDWRLLLSTCQIRKNGAAESNSEGEVTYVRSCTYMGRRSDECEGATNGTVQQKTTRSCNDGALSFQLTDNPVKDAEKSDFKFNILSFILIGFSALLLIVLILFCCFVGHMRRKRKEREEEYQTPVDGAMGEKSNSFIASRSTRHNQVPPRVPRHAPKSNWKTPENYEEIALPGEANHGHFHSPARGTTPPNIPPPMAPPPLHRSFEDLADTSFTGELAPSTYTVMAGSRRVPSPPPYNGQRFFPARQISNPPVPQRNMMDDGYPPPPHDLSFDIPSSQPRRKSDGSGRYHPHDMTQNDENIYLESRSRTLGRPNTGSKKKDGHKKRHKKQAVTRGDSVGFSKLHAGATQHNSNEKQTHHSHLYAEIHDNTRF